MVRSAVARWLPRLIHLDFVFWVGVCKPEPCFDFIQFLNLQVGESPPQAPPPHLYFFPHADTSNPMRVSHSTWNRRKESQSGGIAREISGEHLIVLNQCRHVEAEQKADDWPAIKARISAINNLVTFSFISGRSESSRLAGCGVFDFYF